MKYVLSILAVTCFGVSAIGCKSTCDDCCGTCDGDTATYPTNE